MTSLRRRLDDALIENFAPGMRVMLTDRRGLAYTGSPRARDFYHCLGTVRYVRPKTKGTRPACLVLFDGGPSFWLHPARLGRLGVDKGSAS